MEALYVRTRTSPQTGSGKCWLMNGDIVYSPNCSIKSPVLPQGEEPVQFIPNVSQAKDFERARWWKADTEWLGFVPTPPVSYSGVWFDSLSHMPRTPTIADSGMHALFGPLRAVWLQAEEALTDTTKILRDKCQLSFIQPFPPRSWKYHLEHPTPEIAQFHIQRGRDWFAMWFGLVFWMTRKIPEDRGFVEGLMPPNWFRHVVVSHPKHGAMDVLRLSPLLQRMWIIPRVGLWLHHPDDQGLQPSAQWFIEQGVPVWYRWGAREISSSNYRGSTFNLIAPSAQELQLIMTHITRPVEAPTFNSFNHNSYNDYSASFNSFDDSSVSEPVIAPPEQSAELAYMFWEVHFKKMLERHEKQLKNEPPRKKQARLSRERNPPTASAPVYEWVWNDNNEYVRELQRKSEWVFTLSQYSGRQKRYDSFLNQWDCCQYWGPNAEDSLEDVIEILPVGQQDPIPSIYKSSPPAPASNHHVLRTPESPPGAGAVNVDASAVGLANTITTHPDSSPPPSPPPPTNLLSSEGNPVEKQVLDALIQHFGFVPPTPLPPSSASSSLSGHMDAQFLISALGLPTQAVSDSFFNSPLGKLCTTFIRSFINGKKPDDDLWDLSQHNRRTLYFTQRLNSIRTLERTIPIVSSVNRSENVPPPMKSQVFYMFDLGNQATVSWYLAVSSAAHAMYVCRLPGDWSEDELALDLVNKGIPFHTFQRSNELSSAPSEKLVPVMVPMRLSDHVFSKNDFDMYKKQRESCFVQRRYRAALLRGGLIWRIASEHIGVGDAIAGPLGIHQLPGHMISVRDVHGEEYVDDNMADEELDVLCGLYLTFTGQAASLAKKSWFPTTWIFENSGENFGRWTPRNERAWKQRNDMIIGNPGQNAPINARLWRDKLRTSKDHRSLKKHLEDWSKEIIDVQVGRV